MRSAQGKSYSIPEKLNIAILLVVILGTWILLWSASHLSIAWALLPALAFSHLNNTAFSFMHEAVHDVFSEKKWLNDMAGAICAALFPTSFHLQKVAHLGHHRRNRTDQEIYDYYLPGQSRLLRNFQLYAGNLLGLYWLCIPISNLVYLLAPWLYRSRWFIEGVAGSLGFAPYVREIARQGPLLIWLQCLWALMYQVGIWYLLDLNWQGWLLCYGMFALHWSALQYVDHAWSQRDIRNGAWNLKVSSLSRALALNYHFHLAHHQQPDVPWLYLPELVSKDDPQHTFWEIYFSLWRGVKPAPPMGSKAII
jgi:fatty acid desaturase